MSCSRTGGWTVATLLDTSALVVLMRRGRPAALEAVAEAARSELEAGRAMVSVVTSVELRVGARGPGAADRLDGFLARLPVVDAGREIGALAGRMGAVAHSAGETIPLPDLLIAATAVWLEVPLLTCDSDFARGVEVDSVGDEEGWTSLRLHGACRL
jgi:predicted nucleic acid-binding protein